MSRDEDGRAELRRVETAALGGLTVEDARRALDSLRRGGLVVHELVQESFDIPGAGNVMALLLGPPTSLEDLERIRDDWESEHEEVVEKCVAIRQRTEASAQASQEAMDLLWGAFYNERGKTFAEYLARFHGFVELRPDASHFLRWRA